MNETEITGSSIARSDEQRQEGVFAAMTPGRTLAARREELGLSIEQTAGHLNLAPRQIQAIESDNYAALPGMATARGFIRAYAKLVKIDAAPLLAKIATETTALDDAIPLRRALSSKPFSDNRLFAPNERSALSSKPVLAVAAAAVLVAALFGGQRMGWISVFPVSVAQKIDRGLNLLAASASSAPVVDTGRSSASSDQENSRSALPVAQNMSNASAPAEIPPAAANTGLVAFAAATPAPAPAGASDSPSETIQLAPAGARSQAPYAGNALVLKLREDSWIEVRRSDKTAMISRLVKAGTTESFTLAGPVSLTVGNANGVDATLRGAPLELHAEAKNNVARLNLK